MNAFKSMGLVAQVIVTFIVAGIILGVGFKVFPNIMQMHANIKKQEDKLKDLDAEVAKGRNLEKQLPALERDIANREKQLEHLKAVIPPVRSDSEIIQKFEFLAKRSRLDISKVAPQKLRKKDFYDEYPLKLNVAGNYHDLAKFFERMARLPRIFNVSGVKITVNKTVKTKVSQSIKADFTAVTFIYREGNAAPATKKGKKGGKKKGKGDADQDKME